MKPYKIKLSIEERRAIFFAFRNYLNYPPDLRPDHTHGEAVDRCAALFAAEVFDTFDFSIYGHEGTKSIKLSPAKWSIVYVVLDLAYCNNDMEEIKALLRQIFSKIYPIINRSLYD